MWPAMSVSPSLIAAAAAGDVLWSGRDKMKRVECCLRLCSFLSCYISKRRVGVPHLELVGFLNHRLKEKPHNVDHLQSCE